MQLLLLLFSPRGAITRGQFAWGQLVAFGLAVLIFGLVWLFVTVGFVQNNAVTPIDIEATVLALRSMHAVEAYHFITPYTQVVFGIFVLAKICLVWIHICLVLKRLSDLDFSRWWAVLFYFFTIPGWINIPVQYTVFRLACGVGVAVFCAIFFLWGSRILHEAEKPKAPQGLFWLLFLPNGAIARLGFLGGMLCSVAFLGIVFWLFALCFEHITHTRLSPSANINEMYTLFETYHMVEIALVVLGSAFICMLWMQLCVMLKRLSDLRLSRWFAVIPFITPTLFVIKTQLAANAIQINITSAVNFLQIVVLCFFLLLLFWPTRQKHIEI